ncbi:MAG: NUDIX hydrolase [Candidatus Hydrogenedentes bacterium]|nr:NUDIX hydrolase [Candidatus Hydrogenedentota bacterium]
MRTENPWTTCGSRVVYKNPWITVREDDVIRPDGKKGIYGVVDTRIATAVIAMTPQSEIYLVGQFRYPTNVYSWELIEGGTDPGESALVGAQRELREEAGLVADNWRQLGGEIHISNCFSSEIGYVYLAEGLTHTDSEPEGTEVLQVKKVSFEECLSMVDSGKIVDALSIVGILRAERFLRGIKS